MQWKLCLVKRRMKACEGADVWQPRLCGDVSDQPHALVALSLERKALH